MCQHINIIPLGLTGNKSPNINLVREQCSCNIVTHVGTMLWPDATSFLMEILQAAHWPHFIILPREKCLLICKWAQP